MAHASILFLCVLVTPFVLMGTIDITLSISRRRRNRRWCTAIERIYEVRDPDLVAAEAEVEAFLECGER